jgi:hypothetical protein
MHLDMLPAEMRSDFIRTISCWLTSIKVLIFANGSTLNEEVNR